jgi:hypothetical protein
MKLVFVSVLAASAVGATWAQAQSGHALMLAERSCLAQGIAPRTATYNNCVARVARAYDRGELRDPYSSRARQTRQLPSHPPRYADEMFYPRAGGSAFR